jgi:hypothetical protein
MANNSGNPTFKLQNELFSVFDLNKRQKRTET